MQVGILVGGMVGLESGYNPSESMFPTKPHTAQLQVCTHYCTVGVVLCTYTGVTTGTNISDHKSRMRGGRVRPGGEG